VGESPGPGPASSARWDPKPALELAIRPSALGRGVRAGRSGGGPWQGAGIDPRARARGTGQGREVGDAVVGRSGMEFFRRGLPQGFRGKNTLPQTFRRCRRKLLKMFINALRATPSGGRGRRPIAGAVLSISAIYSSFLRSSSKVITFTAVRPFRKNSNDFCCALPSGTRPAMTKP
jgi:hypothetical protein